MMVKKFKDHEPGEIVADPDWRPEPHVPSQLDRIEEKIDQLMNK